MEDLARQREAEAAVLENEIAEVCGILNAATGRLVKLIARLQETRAHEGYGIQSPEQWVAWKCGLSPARARKLVTMARRLGELPSTRQALEAGELSEDQVAVVCRHAPGWSDADVATFAREATVSQLSRTLRNYAWPTPAEDAPQDEKRRVSFGYTDEGSWCLSAVLPPDEGALVERALEGARQGLEEEGTVSTPGWADALVAVADRSLGGLQGGRAPRDRHLVLVHVGTDGHGTHGHLHLGPALPDALRRQLSCDGRVRAVIEGDGVAVNVGRTRRIVPERTRLAVEERDGGCRVPGCDRRRWLEVHHVTHWEDGGATDTDNLVVLCSRHHRLHHLGHIGITGSADRTDGLVFTDRRGRRLTGCGRPAPPGELAVHGNWKHPSGERLDPRWVYFGGAPG